MVWYVITFITGVFIGTFFAVFMLGILSGNKVNEDIGNDTRNPDGTPKRIIFNKNDV